PGFHRRGSRASRSRRRPARPVGACAGRDERRPHAQRGRHRPRRHGARAGRARPRRAARRRPARRSPRGCAAGASAGGATVRRGELGGDGSPLGSVGGALDLRRTAQRATAGPRRRSRPQVEHADRRSRNPATAGAVVGRAGEGGGVTLGWADGRTVGEMVLLAVMALSTAPTVRLSAQSDTVRVAVLRVAQTRPDSARAMARRLLASLSPQDSVYPGVLFTAGRIAADAATAATNLQRVVVEYGRSVWADSALVLLTQLYFAQGDPAATVQAAERLRRDYPDSPLKPRAEFWGARAYFDLKDDAHGCPLLQEALGSRASAGSRHASADGLPWWRSGDPAGRSRHATHAAVPRDQGAVPANDSVLPDGRLLRDVRRRRPTRRPRARSHAHVAQQRWGGRGAARRRTGQSGDRVPAAPDCQGAPGRDLRTGRGPQARQGAGASRSGGDDHPRDGARRGLARAQAQQLPRGDRPARPRTGTARNMALVASLRPDGGVTGATVLEVLDRTMTSRGARRLRRWLLAPLVDPGAINARRDAVEGLVRDPRGRDRVREALDGVRDLERLAGRAALGRATPRELGALRDSIARLPDVRSALDGLEARGRAAALEQAAEHFDLLADLGEELARAL